MIDHTTLDPLEPLRRAQRETDAAVADALARGDTAPEMQELVDGRRASVEAFRASIDGADVMRRLLDEALAYAAVFHATSVGKPRRDAQKWIVETLQVLGRNESAERFAAAPQRKEHPGPTEFPIHLAGQQVSVRLVPLEGEKQRTPTPRDIARIKKAAGALLAEDHCG